MADLSASADKLISKNGFDMVYKTVTTGAYDVATGSATTTTTSKTIKGVVVESKEGRQKDSVIATVTDRDVLTAKAMRRVMVSGKSITPKREDFLVIASVDWKITGIEAIYSGEVVAAYFLTVEAV